MSEPVTLPELKAHLRIGPGVTGDDAELSSMILAARCHCEVVTGRKLVGEGAETDEGMIAVFVHAIKVLCAAWWDDRAGEFDPPAAVGALLRPLRIMGAP